MSNGSGSSVDPAAAQDSMKALEKLAAMLARVTDETGRYTDAQNELERALETGSQNNERRANQEEEEIKRRERAWKSLQQQAAGVNTLSGAYGVAKNAVMLYIEQNKKLAKTVTNLVAAFKGAQAGAKLTAAALKGIFSIGGSLVSMFFDIGAAIISIPFKFFNHVFGKAKELMSGGTELAQAYEDVRKVFGDTGSGLGKSVINLGKNLTKGLITPGLSARRVFGDMAEAIKYANEVASASPEAFQAVSDQFSGKNGLEILAMAKGLGIANEELVGFMDSAIATGQPMETMLTDVTKYAKGMGDAFGLNSKMISRSMAKAAKDVKHFANSSVKEIAQATVYAQKLGVSLESITGILDAFNTFESAAENVSKLSQAFGVNLDAMKLLEAKTPDEALDQVKQAFLAAGKSADQMNRQELQLIASTVGMDEATVRKTLSMKNAGVSMQNVKGVASSLEAQTMNTSQALEKLSKDIEKMVKAGEPPKGDNFLDVFIEGFIEGVDRSGKMRELFKDTAKAIQMVRIEGRLLGDFFVKNFPGFSDFIEGLSEKMEQVPELFADIRRSIEFFISGLGNGSSSFENLMNNIKKNFMDFMGGDNSQMSKGLAKMWDATKMILAQGINWLTDRLKEGLNAVVSFIKNPLETQAGAASGILGDVDKQIAPIKDALKRMWIELKDPIKELLWEVAKEFVAAIWEGIKALPWYAWLVLAAPSLIGGLGNVIAQGIARGIASKIVAKAASSALGATGEVAGEAASKGIMSRLLPALKSIGPALSAAATTAGSGTLGSALGGGAIAGGAALGLAGAAAIGGLALFAYQAKELYNDVQKHEEDRNDILKANEGLSDKQLETYRQQTKTISDQVHLIEKKLKLGQLTEKEAAFEKKKLDIEKKAETYGILSAADSRARATMNLAQDELQAGYIKAGDVTKSMDAAFAESRKMVDEGVEGAAAHMTKSFQGYADTIKENMKGKLGEGIDEAGNWSASSGMPALLLQLQNADAQALEEIAQMGIDDLETSGAEWSKKYAQGGLDLTKQQAAFIKAQAAAAIFKRKDEADKKAAPDIAAAQKKAAEEAKKKAEEQAVLTARQDMLDSMGLDNKWTPQTVEVAINKVDEMAKKLGKTDVGKTMETIRKKMDAIDFKVFTPAKQTEVTQAAIDMGLVLKIFNNLGALGPEVTKTRDSLAVLNKGKGIEDINASIDKFVSMFKGDTNLFARVNSLAAIAKDDAAKLLEFPTTINDYFTNANASLDSMRAGAEGLGEIAMKAKEQLEIEGGAKESLHLFADTIANFFNEMTRVEAAITAAQKSNANIVAETQGIDSFVKSLAALATFFTAESAETIKASVSHMVDGVNAINKGLSDIKLGEKDIRVKLGDAAGGIVKKAFEPIKAGGATISLTLNVQMSATDLATGLVRSPNGIIRSAFRAALADTGQDMNDNGIVGPIT